MSNYPSLEKKAARYSAIIKEEHRKPKSERRHDLTEIVVKQNTIKRWIKELQKTT